MEVISKTQITQREYWVKEIIKISGNFGADANKIQQEINDEIQNHGIESLVGHLRLCGAIPEQYGHDTSEEKLYSKYTDIVVSEAFSALGLNSIVLTERGDTADVECVAHDYSFVADAKAFRLSRTAKNQKDFKIQALDTWKHGKPYAVLICPIYQLPSQKSQIYQQSIVRSVNILTYTHLTILLRYSTITNQGNCIQLLHKIFQSLDLLNPTKDALSYWRSINLVFLNYDKKIQDLWLEERQGSSESVMVAKKEALTFFASERERIMKLSRQQAIQEVLKYSKIDRKIQSVQSVQDNPILNLED